MAKEGSVAPRERVNIVYKSATGGAQEEKELPLRLLMLGDYTLKTDERQLEDRKPISVDKNNFGEVLKNQNLELSFGVRNTLVDEEDAELPVSLKIESLKDFEPESIARNVPELAKLLELREALTALKGPLGNFPAFRKKIESIVSDQGTRDTILQEISGSADSGD